jgi:hypothetical protein
MGTKDRVKEWNKVGDGATRAGGGVHVGPSAVNGGCQGCTASVRWEDAASDKAAKGSSGCGHNRVECVSKDVALGYDVRDAVAKVFATEGTRQRLGWNVQSGGGTPAIEERPEGVELRCFFIRCSAAVTLEVGMSILAPTMLDHRLDMMCGKTGRPRGQRRSRCAAKTQQPRSSKMRATVAAKWTGMPRGVRKHCCES